VRVCEQVSGDGQLGLDGRGAVQRAHAQQHLPRPLVRRPFKKSLAPPPAPPQRLLELCGREELGAHRARLEQAKQAADAAVRVTPLVEQLRGLLAPDERELLGPDHDNVTRAVQRWKRATGSMGEKLLVI
jgi:hypothetical protein